MTEQLDIQIRNKVGLHARPASLFVRAATKYSSQITVKNKTTSSKAVSAKSILGVLTLGVQQNHEITVEATGDDASQAIAELRELIENDFGEGDGSNAHIQGAP